MFPSLTHLVDERPKFRQLKDHPFIAYIEKEDVDVAGWYGSILEKEQELCS